MTREEMALKMLLAWFSRDMQPPSENDIRMAFRLAQLFEKVSDEEGGRPFRSTGKRSSLRAMTFDDEDE